MRINYWILNAGGKTGQEGKEQKRSEGLAFIERLKQEGETILNVIDEGGRLRIELADAEDLVIENPIVEEVIPEVIPTIEQVTE